VFWVPTPAPKRLANMPDVTSQVTGGSNPDVQAMHIVIVGLGLIGASFAAALRQAGFAGRITGVVRSSATGEQALQQRLVDAVHHDIGAAVSDADVVLLAVPMLAMEAQLQGMVATLPDAAIVTDAGSVKGYFAQLFEQPVAAGTGSSHCRC